MGPPNILGFYTNTLLHVVKVVAFSLANAGLSFGRFIKMSYFTQLFSDKITDEKNTSEDWGTILDLCDRVQNAPNGPRDCLKSITKRLQHQVGSLKLFILQFCLPNFFIVKN